MSKEVNRHELVGIQNALVVLGNSRTPIAYHIARNLRKVGDKLDEIQKDVKELQKLHCEMEHDEAKTELIEVDGKKYNKLVFKTPEDEKQYTESVNKLFDEKHKMDWYMIPEAKVAELQVEGTALAIIFDHIISQEVA